MQVRVLRHKMKFRFPAATSRGPLSHHSVHWVLLTHEGRLGIGEASPLAGLSPESSPEFSAELVDHVQRLCRDATGPKQVMDRAAASDLPSSVRFAVETACLDLAQEGGRRVYDNAFSRGEATVPINGLVWMGEADYMRRQVQQKLEQGYGCIKLKIGALDWQQELDLLTELRRQAPDIVMRVDANGAFSTAEAVSRLDQLAALRVQSIEQPIAVGQWDDMARLCEYTPVPIALDEELIGVQSEAMRRQLLEHIRPQHVVLKPTLHGGLGGATAWIALAEQLGVGWWLTSALESNIGLNAIAQLAGQYPAHETFHGLGTGQIYTENVQAPLLVDQGSMRLTTQPWSLDLLQAAEVLLG